MAGSNLDDSIQAYKPGYEIHGQRLHGATQLRIYPRGCTWCNFQNQISYTQIYCSD